MFTLQDKEVNRLKMERDSLEVLRRLTEAENISMQEKLKKREVECAELSQRVNRLIDEHKSLAYSMIKAEEMHRTELEKVKRAEAEGMKMITAELKRKNKEVEEAKRAEAEGMKTIAELERKINQLEEAKRAEAEGMKKIEAELKKKNNELEDAKTAEAEGMKTITELKRKNKELEEEIMHYGDIFQQRISDVEEIAVGLLGKDVAIAREGNRDDRNSCRCSTMLRSSSNSGGNHSSHRQKQDLFADNCDIDVCKKKPVIGSLIAAAEGPNTLIYITDSDDESAADESAVIVKTNGVNLTPSLNEMPSVNKKMPSVKTGEKHGMKDSSCSFVYRRKRKRSLSRGDEANRSVISREKTQDSGEIFHDDKGLFSNGVNLEPTFKEMPSVNKKMLSVNTEDKNGLNQPFDSVHRRKTGLISGDEANRSVLGSQKTQDIREFFDDDNVVLFNGCSTNGKSVAFGTEGNITPRKRHLESNDLQELDGKHSSDQPSLRKHILTDTVSSDCSSSDSDDGFTADSDIDNTIAKLRKKAWKSAVDLASEFKKNYELCMKAVCVLYRRTLSDENLTTDPSIPATPGLGHFIAMGGKELAELLTKGDQKHRLRNSVPEVKIKHPEALKRCRELAIHYNEKLFEIYRKGEDPFFCCACL